MFGPWPNLDPRTMPTGGRHVAGIGNPLQTLRIDRKGEGKLALNRKMRVLRDDAGLLT